MMIRTISALAVVTAVSVSLNAPIFAMPSAADPIALVAASGSETKAELKERFEQRYAALNKIKEQGKVGETWQGFIEAVKGDDSLDADARKLMADENGDRRKLYALIADEVVKGEQKVPVDKVAERNARRNFQKAKPNEFIKLKDGMWMQRQEVAALKKGGKIGETWEGTVEAVKGAELNERATAVTAEENRIRKEIYERDASKNKTTAAKEAQEAGKKNIDSSKPGEFIKNKDGSWVKK